LRPVVRFWVSVVLLPASVIDFDFKSAEEQLFGSRKAEFGVKVRGLLVRDPPWCRAGPLGRSSQDWVNLWSNSRAPEAAETQLNSSHQRKSGANSIKFKMKSNWVTQLNSSPPQEVNELNSSPPQEVNEVNSSPPCEVNELNSSGELDLSWTSATESKMSNPTPTQRRWGNSLNSIQAHWPTQRNSNPAVERPTQLNSTRQLIHELTQPCFQWRWEARIRPRGNPSADPGRSSPDELNISQDPSVSRDVPPQRFARGPHWRTQRPFRPLTFYLFSLKFCRPLKFARDLHVKANF
jgi:hypothetical protein